MIKSYRGKLENDQSAVLNLHTNDGRTGYTIKKFQLIGEAPGLSGTIETVCKIYSVQPTGIDGLIDFNDPTLLGVAMWSSSSDSFNSYQSIIFDNEVFNQDIYVTYTDEQGASNNAGNYYIELEQIDLTEHQALVAIVKDLREEQ